MIRYHALGDSTSIDKYTNKIGGGAASQLAHLLGATAFNNATADGATTGDVLALLEGPEHWRAEPFYDVITLTIGGNDLLAPAVLGRPPVGEAGWRLHAHQIATRVETITEHLLRLCAPGGTIVFNTVYDPTDDDDAHLIDMGLPAVARAGLEAYNAALNERIKTMDPQGRRFLLCDAHALFKGHGYWSQDPWLTLMIEPNLAGATALAEAWLALIALA